MLPARAARKRSDLRAGASRRHHTVTRIGTAIDTEDQQRLAQSLEQAQREAAENLALFETLHSASPVGFGFVDRDLRVVSLNAALARVNGTPIESQLGRRVADVVPELWSKLEPVFRGVLDTGASVINIELNAPAAGDPATVQHWLASYYPVRIDDEIIGIGIVAVDTTERRQAEALRSTIMDNMAEGLYTLDAEGCLTFLNASGAKILGWTEAELRGSSMHSVVHNQHADGSPNPESECELLKVRSQGRTIRVSGDVFTRKDGTIVPVAYSAAPLVDESTVDGVVVVFRDTSEERAAEERVQRELAALAWVGRIREALDEDRFILYSQPIVPLQGGDTSEELLVRMIGRGGEIILPGSFIPIAERYGMIGEIDRWVITQAIHFAARGHRVEVNVSAQSMAPVYLLPLIERELRDSGADPDNLVVEITETALMQDVHAGEIFAQGLADIGCGLSLDDFGTGFASFTHLKRLPLRSLKIDIDFVQSLTTNSANQHIVQSIVHLARGFGYDTIAEGIEDDETLALLRSYGVDYGQGYLFGRPTPLANA
jgi:PAS domain S-box-containing protein